MTTAKQTFKQAYRAARTNCRDRAAGAIGTGTETRRLDVCPLFIGRVMRACGYPSISREMFAAAHAAAEVLALERYRADHPAPTLQQRIETLRDDVYPYN